MRILLTNDDGIDSPGLVELERKLRRLGSVSVAAPARPRSAVSQSITLHKPIVVTPAGRNRFAVDGTPTDCVKLALRELLRRPPELIVSGINRGLNAGCDILYSGTVAGALEGALHGIPSVAVSLEATERMDFREAAAVAVPLLRRLHGDPRIVFNVNIPSRKRARIRGVRVTRQESALTRDVFERRSDPRGRPYYWLKSANGELEEAEAGSNGTWTDARAVGEGYVSITPLTRDLTALSMISDLEGRLGLR
jgi:5'-nucleotidase